MFSGGGQYVFPPLVTRGQPMSENTISHVLRRLGYRGEDQTGHGFRSMVSTLLNEQGYRVMLLSFSCRTLKEIRSVRLTTRHNGYRSVAK
jgi:hypothetical protein